MDFSDMEARAAAHPAEQPAPAVPAPWNPFAGEETLGEEAGRFEVGVRPIPLPPGLIPPPIEKRAGSPETISADIQDSAKEVCNQIAEMFIKTAEPTTIRFPVCDDMNIINEALKQLCNTPLGLGYGALPPAVSTAWGRFMRETAEHYRQRNGLKTAELVPLKLEIPAWLQNSTSFEILTGCTLMDVEIKGGVNFPVAVNATHSRFIFKDNVASLANIGKGAKWSTFVFEKNLDAERSFENSSNLLIQIKGDQTGALGFATETRVECRNTSFRGTFKARGDKCSASPGIRIQGF